MRPSATGDVVIQVLDLLHSGPTNLTAVKGALTLSAGAGANDIYAQTGSSVYDRIGSEWAVQAKDVGQASFAG